MVVALWAIIIVLGLALGSFTTCVIYRVPRRISLWKQENGSYRSFCPNCNAVLQSRDLIPVFSWLFQRGKCRYCRQPIPVRYLLVELAVLVLVCVLAVILGITPQFFIAALMIPAIAGILSFFLVKPKL
jgi:leader peptidase (prepilin peptidase) / N-methyltransferase